MEFQNSHLAERIVVVLATIMKYSSIPKHEFKSHYE